MDGADKRQEAQVREIEGMRLIRLFGGRLVADSVTVLRTELLWQVLQQDVVEHLTSLSTLHTPTVLSVG